MMSKIGVYFVLACVDAATTKVTAKTGNFTLEPVQHKKNSGLFDFRGTPDRGIILQLNPKSKIVRAFKSFGSLLKRCVSSSSARICPDQDKNKNATMRKQDRVGKRGFRRTDSVACGSSTSSERELSDPPPPPSTPAPPSPSKKDSEQTHRRQPRELYFTLSRKKYEAKYPAAAFEESKHGSVSSSEFNANLRRSFCESEMRDYGDVDGPTFSPVRPILPKTMKRRKSSSFSHHPGGARRHSSTFSNRSPEEFVYEGSDGRTHIGYNFR